MYQFKSRNYIYFAYRYTEYEMEQKKKKIAFTEKNQSTNNYTLIQYKYVWTSYLHAIIVIPIDEMSATMK